jgi:hypothetical protein
VKYGYRVVYDSRSKLDAKLFTVMLGKEWNWPPASSEDLVKIISVILAVILGKKFIIEGLKWSIGDWFGFLYLFLSKLLFFALLLGMV